MSITYGGTYTSPRLDLGEAFREYMFMASDFAGLQLYPIFETPKKKGVFPSRPKENMLRNEDLKRAPRSAYNRGTLEAEEKSYTCEEYGFEVALDHSEREFYKSDFDAEMAASEEAFWHVMLAHEVRVAALVFDGTTTFTTGNGRRTDVSTAWSTTTSDIIGDVQTAKESVRSRTGANPNVLAIGAATLPSLLTNDDIRGAIQPTRLPTMAVILEALAALLGLERVVVGGSVQNTAIEGQAASLSDVWGSGWAAVMKVANPGASLRESCVGRTMLWVDDSPDSVMVEEYEEPQTRATVFRARHYVDELEIDPDFEQLLDIAG